MFDHIGWIVEAKIKEGRRDDFKAIVDEIVTKTQDEGGTLTYKYFVSDDGDVLVLEQFNDVESAHIHITTWDNYAERWLEAAPGTRMVHLGNLPEALRERHGALAPKLLKPFAGFSR
ncbi:putative quinol monooxygenase [Agarilytica rhodophyticola]|uniref:putative quinol monooxygenase n=1 Tax=Agarilytica rhodophyticola TaxID=1737490 RepID=UPI000B347FF3|nr:antibiotic biosynthesis monooxygenase [Agarilytica rhodophyticola]